MSSPNPFPDVVIPGISAGVNYCIFRVDRTFDGVFEGAQRASSSYDCPSSHHVQKTTSFSSKITWRITAALNCDESISVWPPTLLSAKGITIAREDGFAHFIGSFSIVKKQSGQPDVTYFKGPLELIGRSGSHQSLGEACDEEQHIEGWIMGRGQGPVRKYTLQAVIVAKGKLSIGVGAFPDASVNRLTGTLIKSP